MKTIIYIHSISETLVENHLQNSYQVFILIDQYKFQLKSAYATHIDHVDAVLDVDWSPNGKELVSASYDRTVRIFPQGK